MTLSSATADTANTEANIMATSSQETSFFMVTRLLSLFLQG